jgi:hypothetical protein
MKSSVRFYFAGAVMLVALAGSINAGALFAQVAGAPASWCVIQPGSGIQADCAYDDSRICDMAASVAGGTCKARSNLIGPRRKATIPSPPQRKLSVAEHDKLLAGSDSDSCGSCHRTTGRGDSGRPQNSR